MRGLTSVLLSALAAASFAQIDDSSAEPIRGAMQPAISPDGSKIAFRYRGDIWFASSDGGVATRITDHVEFDQEPIWSPDGKWIAFSSDREGNYDIYAAPVAGGETRHITYSPANEVATDWSPDGNWILYAGTLETPWPGIYAVDVRDLRFKRLAIDYMGLRDPHFSPDGKTVVALRSGFPWTRPRYYGSAAAQLVTISADTGRESTLVSNQRQHLWPMYSPSGKAIYAVTYGDITPSSSNIDEHPGKFVDSASRTPNIWKFELNGKGQRVTNFVGEQVRFPSIAQNGTIAYERGGRLYIFKNNEEREVKVIAHVDSKVNAIERNVFTNGASEAVVSPDKKTFALVVGSEIWTAPLEKGKGRNKDDATRLTDYPGVDEDIAWSKDGKAIYFISDRDEYRRLYSLDVETKKVTPIWAGNDDAMSPILSPDGTRLAFWVAGDTGGLYVWPTSGGPAKRVFEHPGSQLFGTGSGEFSWSPDGAWIALTRRQNGTVNVWITPSDGSGTPVNITRRNVDHGRLAWSPDGKYLYFGSDADGGGYFIVPLMPESEDPQEAEFKYEKPKDPVKVQIDFNDIDDRIRKLFGQGVSGNVVTDKTSGEIYFLASGGLFVSSYDGKSVRQLVGGISSFTLSDDGKTAYALHDGVPATVRLEGNVGISDIAFRAELVQDANLVRKAAFTEFWRMYNRGFYDPNFHRRDWVAIRQRYEPLLEGVGHRREFSELLNMMVGELEASHSEVGPAPGGTRGGPSLSLPGFNFDYSYAGPGIKVGSIFKDAPGYYQKTHLNPGDYVLAINGKDVRLDEHLWDVLKNQGGRDLVLTVNSKPSKDGAREIKYRAISPGEWNEMWYQQWVESNRKAVEKASGGKIGYIHIRGMGGGDRQRFEEQFYEYKQGKDAMIIDVRFNGGGNISDSLIDVLERKSHGFYRQRDGYIEPAPGTQVWDRPIVVLANESSYSNAEMFPYAMHDRGLAKLIGMPTPGYVIWTRGGQLVDGTSMRMPSSGVYRSDGTPMEDNGQKPDIVIPWSNEDYMAGKDPQLDRAISELLKEVKN